MKRYFFIISIIAVITVLIFISCEDSFGKIKKTDVSVNVLEKTVRHSSDVTGGFDLKPFIDVTLKNIDAFDINIYDFEELLSSEYNNKGNTINFNLKEGKVTFCILSSEIRS